MSQLEKTSRSNLRLGMKVAYMAASADAPSSLGGGSYGTGGRIPAMCDSAEERAQGRSTGASVVVCEPGRLREGCSAGCHRPSAWLEERRTGAENGRGQEATL